MELNKCAKSTDLKKEEGVKMKQGKKYLMHYGNVVTQTGYTKETNDKKLLKKITKDLKHYEFMWIYDREEQKCIFNKNTATDKVSLNMLSN